MLADRIADFLFKGGNITDEEKEIICLDWKVWKEIC